MPRGAQREATLCGGCAGRVLITETSPTAACTPAQKCIEGVNAEHVLADKGYDRDAIVIQAAAQEMNSLLPSKKNRKVQRPLDQDIYKLLRNSVCLSSPQKMKGR